jgi:hypothetical protein
MHHETFIRPAFSADLVHLEQNLASAYLELNPMPILCEDLLNSLCSLYWNR